VLLSIPKPENEHDFWALEIDESGGDVSAFNTMDFERTHPHRFDKYAYRLEKIYERVHDLALLHSSISNEQGKKNIHQRFRSLVEKEFRDKALMLLETHRRYPHLVNKEKLFNEITEQNRRIRKCNDIWKKLAYQE
jgi:hypothetical protein